MNNESTIIFKEAVPQNFRPQPITDDHFKFGASMLPKKIIMPTGNGWKAHRPDGETQFRNGFDPQSCPAGGTLNALETLGKLQYSKLGFQSNLSERYLSIIMGMNGQGGWPWGAAEYVRWLGSIPESFLPFDDSIQTIKQYFSPRPMSYKNFKTGLHWATVYDFGFEWVYEPGDNLTDDQKRARMMEALKYSTLGVAGYAWSLHSDGKYYNDGPAIHWFVVDGFIENEYWDAFDTYIPYGKKLDWSYVPAYCMRYNLSRKPGADTIVFNPDDAPEVRIEYIKYLFSWFISLIKP